MAATDSAALDFVDEVGELRQQLALLALLTLLCTTYLA
jgi:hypothetical protein